MRERWLLLAALLAGAVGLTCDVQTQAPDAGRKLGSTIYVPPSNTPLGGIMSGTAGGATLAWPAVSWATAAWYVDPSNVTTCAADTNSCTSATCSVGGVGPCLTYGQIVSRWGTISPRLRQSTTIEFLSSHTDNTDPVYFRPFIEAGAVVQIFGPLGAAQQIASGVLSNVTAKNRSTPQLLLANSGATAVGQLVVNTTHASRAWTYAVSSGSIYKMTEPSVAVAVPGSCGAGVDTWANGDSVTVYQPVKVNLVDVSATFDQLNGGFNNVTVFIYNVSGFDPASFNCLHLTNATLYESYSARFVKFDGSPGVGFSFCNDVTNNGISGGSFTTNTTISAGAHGLSGQINDLFNIFLNTDVILASPTGVGATFANASAGSPVYIETGKALNVTGSFNGSGGIWWGPGTINLFGQARFVYTANAATNLLSGIKINNGTTACSHTGASPDVIACGITLSAANLDAAAGVAGFGGLAFNVGGGAFTTGGL
jgi:hypothetical protein